MSIRASRFELTAHHNQLLWFCSNGQPLEMSQLAHPEASGCEAGGVGVRSLSLSTVGAAHRTRECEWKINFDVHEPVICWANFIEQAQDSNSKFFVKLFGKPLDG
jgi:hypothetical protein